MPDTKNETPKLFDAFQDNNFGRDRCFLCGKKLNSQNQSDEHVFPKWLQERFNLWDKELILLNGTSIPYRQLKIPCCKTCNGEYLSTIERRVCEASKSNAQEVRGLGKEVLFQWLGKIFYGLLYKEFLLPLKRSKPSEGPIVPENLLEKYKLHHLFLQSTRLSMDFNQFPASIFVFDLQKVEDEINYNFRDDFNLMTISIRLGKVGIIAGLQDGSTQEKIFKDYFEKLYDIDLHVLQYNELIAKFFYKTYLMNRVPKYTISGTDDHVQVFQLPLRGMSKSSIYNDWNQREYASFLSQISGYPFEELFYPPDKTISWIYNEEGELRVMDQNEG